MTDAMATKERALRVGVVGAGRISDYHLAALTRLEGVRVAAVAATRAHRAREVAEAFGVPEAFDDWRLLSGRIDAAVVATPDETHAEIARGLIDAGVAVMVQKPLAVRLDDAERLVTSAPPGMLSVSLMHRHLGATVRLAELLAEGALGAVMSARIRNATPGPDWSPWFFRDSGFTSGVVGQLGVHGIDLVELLLGRIRSVSAMTAIRMPQRRMADGTVVDSEVPDHALATYRLVGGALVSHEQCWAEAGGTSRFRLEIHGTDASVALTDPDGPLTLISRDGERRTIPPATEPVLGYRHHERWLASVRAGADDGTARDALRGLRVVEAIGAAAATGSVVELNVDASAEVAGARV